MTSFRDQARLEITHFATWYMGFGSFENNFRKVLSPWDADVGRGLGLEGVLGGGSEGRQIEGSPTGLPVVGIAVWSRCCWSDRDRS